VEYCNNIKGKALKLFSSMSKPKGTNIMAINFEVPPNPLTPKNF
jgi:hypothetical protein